MNYALVIWDPLIETEFVHTVYGDKNYGAEPRRKTDDANRAEQLVSQ
jgi:hypothetical protein